MNKGRIDIIAPRHCKVLYLGTPGAHIQNIWIVLHGYGQLAEYFLKNFEPVSDESTLIVAPEGLSRFYLDGLSGRVGSSWMTKEERELEIEDNNTYLNLVLEQSLKASNPDAKVHVLAFSQGVPVACRWLIQSLKKPQVLVLWAGALPHDVQLPYLKELFETIQTKVIYGNQDEYVNQIGAHTLHEFIAEHGIRLQVETFDGGHHLEKDTLMRIFNIKNIKSMD